MRGQQCAGQTDMLSSDSAANIHQGLAYKPSLHIINPSQRQNRPGSVVTIHDMSRLCDIKELSVPTLSGLCDIKYLSPPTLSRWIVRLTRARDTTVLVQLSLFMICHVSVTSKSFRFLHYQINPGQRHNRPGSVVTIHDMSRLCDIKELSAPTLSGWIVRLTRARDKTVLSVAHHDMSRLCDIKELSAPTLSGWIINPGQRHNRPGSVVTIHDMSRVCDIKELSAPTLSGWIVRLTRARDTTVLVQLSLSMIFHVSVTSKSFRFLHYQINPGQRQNRPGSVVTNHDMSRLCDIKELSAPTLSGWIVRLTRARDKTVLVQLSLTMPRHVSDIKERVLITDSRYNPGHPEPCTRKES
ncbi:hypothetical protein J6590_080613 [Homalodisca vitripennis]|nr:hypothetical protein J6590_080613 [Homalodisca vitripennis]